MAEENRNERLKAEAERILAAAREEKLETRLLGGMAVYLSSPCTRNDPFAREVQDLDFVVARKKAYSFSKLLERIGFQGDHEFNSIHGETRMLFSSDLTDIDVFVGYFQQCHTLDLEKYFRCTAGSIPLACLLLTKLQIVQINKKDILDTLALLYDHEPQKEGDAEREIRLDQFDEVLCGDWGWYTTVTDNLLKIEQMLPDLGFGPEAQSMLLGRIRSLLTEAEGAPKSLKWKMRAKIGRKMQWYDLPEEKVL